jgi:hypothetical protein
MGKSLDQEDDWPALHQGSGHSAAKLFSLAILVYLLIWAVGFVFVSRVFGIGITTLLFLIPVLPLVDGLRMRRRWPVVRAREFAFLALLLIVASGCVIGVVKNWYETGMDRRHAEDVKWAEFGRALRQDTAFQDLEIHSSRKHTYWVSGTVASEADVRRLNWLAIGCGITPPLDGPFVSDVSITITPAPEAVLPKVTAAAAPITEIYLEREPGNADNFSRGSPFQKVTIHRDGKVTRWEINFRGGTNQEETLSGSIGSEAFLELENLLHRKRFFSMTSPKLHMHATYVEVAASSGSGMASVRGKSGFGDPEGFNEIVEAIDKLVAQVTDWQKVK